jgi:hypothetical protein
VFSFFSVLEMACFFIRSHTYKKKSRFRFPCDCPQQNSSPKSPAPKINQLFEELPQVDFNWHRAGTCRPVEASPHTQVLTWLGKWRGDDAMSNPPSESNGCNPSRAGSGSSCSISGRTPKQDFDLETYIHRESGPPIIHTQHGMVKVPHHELLVGKRVKQISQARGDFQEEEEELRIVAAVAFLSRAFVASPRCMHDIKTALAHGITVRVMALGMFCYWLTLLGNTPKKTTSARSTAPCIPLTTCRLLVCDITGCSTGYSVRVLSDLIRLPKVACTQVYTHDRARLAGACL